MMSNLKPLNWQPNKDSLWSKNGMELVGAVGAGIAYTVTGIDGKYIVTISNLVKAERGQPRSSDKISKDFDSLDEAKSFVEQEHYPHFMSEFINQDSISDISAWFKAAKPEPTDKDRLTQIGCHYEEVAEMMVACQGEQHMGSKVMDNCARGYKNFLPELAFSAQPENNIELLDALCDQIVTAVGVGYMMGFDMMGALREVIRSNNSKMVGGKFECDENGKIMKPDSYSEPDLAPFLNKGE